MTTITPPPPLTIPAPARLVEMYHFDAQLTDDERGGRDRVRAWSDLEVVPVINGYWERAEFPFVLVPGLARLAIAGGQQVGHGRPGSSAVGEGLAAAELARGDGSVSTFNVVHSGLAMASIDHCSDRLAKVFEAWLWSFWPRSGCTVPSWWCC